VTRKLSGFSEKGLEEMDEIWHKRPKRDVKSSQKLLSQSGLVG